MNFNEIRESLLGHDLNKGLQVRSSVGAQPSFEALTIGATVKTLQFFFEKTKT